MKKWEEEQRKKRHLEKMSKVKPTLNTQPKGAKTGMARANQMSASGHYSGQSFQKYGPGSYLGDSDRGGFPARGKAGEYINVQDDFDGQLFEFGPHEHANNYQGQPGDMQIDRTALAISQSQAFQANRKGMQEMEVVNSAGDIGMFNMLPNDYDSLSPLVQNQKNLQSQQPFKVTTDIKAGSQYAKPKMRISQSSTQSKQYSRPSK